MRLTYPALHTPSACSVLGYVRYSLTGAKPEYFRSKIHAGLRSLLPTGAEPEYFRNKIGAGYII